LPIDASVGIIGDTVLKVLHGSQESIPQPTKWNDEFWEMLDLAGVKTWATFQKGASCIGFESDRGWLTMRPFANKGARDGYTPLQEKNFCIPCDSTPEAIGNAVQKAVSLCE
jgi:hypothetical protein